MEMGGRGDDKDFSLRENKMKNSSLQITDSPVEEKILIAGFGGQGVMLLGKILALSGSKEDKFTTYLPSYGAEMRGGTAHCFVRISSQEIASPIFEFPTTFLFFNQESFDKFIKKANDKSLMIVNNSLITPSKKTSNMKEIPLSEIAAELGSPKTANIIALGVFVKKTAVIKPASVREAIKEIFNGKTSILNSNLKAFETGLTYG